MFLAGVGCVTGITIDQLSAVVNHKTDQSGRFSGGPSVVFSGRNILWPEIRLQPVYIRRMMGGSAGRGGWPASGVVVFTKCQTIESFSFADIAMTRRIDCQPESDILPQGDCSVKRQPSRETILTASPASRCWQHVAYARDHAGHLFGLLPPA